MAVVHPAAFCWGDSMIVHLPHASDFIPPAYRQLFVLDKESLRQELLRMTDWYTDLLFSGVGVPLRFPISRLVCDVERFRDPAQEPMAAQGMWICYTRTSSLEALKQWDVSHVRQILSRYYDPHHRSLSALVAQELSQTGRALIVDGHSFSSRPLPYERDSLRPDICIGTDAFHTPPSLQHWAHNHFAQRGYRVALNRPFSGAIVPLAYLGRQRCVYSIMIEINRSLYMQEDTGLRTPAFARVQRDIQAFLRSISSFDWLDA